MIIDSATSGVQSCICGHQATCCEHLNNNDSHTEGWGSEQKSQGNGKGEHHCDRALQ